MRIKRNKKRRVESPHKNDYMSLLMKGVLADYKHDYPSSISNFTRAISLEPLNYEAYLQRSLSFYSIDQDLDAINDLETCLRTCHLSKPDLLLFKGLVDEIKLNNYQTAKEKYSEALEIDPLHFWSAFSLGFVAEVSEDYKNAKIFYKKALKIKSRYNDCMVLHNIGSCYLKEIENNDNNNNNINEQQLVSLSPKKIKKFENLAEKYFKLSLKSNPECFESLLHLGQLYSRISKFEKSEICFRKILKQDKHHFRSNIMLSNLLYFEKNNSKDSRKYLGRARRARPSQSYGYTLEAIILLNQILEKINEIDEINNDNTNNNNNNVDLNFSRISEIFLEIMELLEIGEINCFGNSECVKSIFRCRKLVLSEWVKIIDTKETKEFVKNLIFGNIDMNDKKNGKNGLLKAEILEKQKILEMKKDNEQCLKFKYFDGKNKKKVKSGLQKCRNLEIYVDIIVSCVDEEDDE